MIRWTVVALAARPDTQTIHAHLTGVRAPVRSEDDVELQVVGRIPDALAGAKFSSFPP